jgi:hypothetical protein
MLQNLATASFKHPIDRMAAAESIVTILGRLNVDKFPAVERMAVASVQIAAIDEWLDAYLDNRAAAQRQDGSPRRLWT